MDLHLKVEVWNSNKIKQYQRSNMHVYESMFSLFGGVLGSGAKKLVVVVLQDTFS